MLTKEHRRFPGGGKSANATHNNHAHRLSAPFRMDDHATACACGGSCPRCSAPASARNKAVDGLDGATTGAATSALTGAATGGAAAGTATKTVSIDAVKLRGAARDPAVDVASANTIFRPANVQFSLRKSVTASTADSDVWLGGDTEISTGTCGAATKEELDTWSGAAAKFKLASRLRAFYVSTISTGSRADSYPPYCATGTAAPLSGMATVSNSGASRSLAHELGHVLLNSPDHPSDPNNLMHPTNTATGSNLTAPQKAAIYANT